MNENLKKLFEVLKADENISEKFSVCKTPEEAYQTAQEIVDGYSFEEFKQAMTEIDKLAKKESGELSEADLEGVAGGSDLELGLTIAGSVIGGAGTIAGAAVAASAASM